MTALPKSQATRKVTLRRRTRDEVLPARSFFGFHEEIVEAARRDTVCKHGQTLADLAKI